MKEEQQNLFDISDDAFMDMPDSAFSEETVESAPGDEEGSQNLIEDTGMLNQQNEELKTLLNQYLHALFNRGHTSLGVGTTIAFNQAFKEAMMMHPLHGPAGAAISGQELHGVGFWLKGAYDDAELGGLFAEESEGIAVARFQDGKDLG